MDNILTLIISFIGIISVIIFNFKDKIFKNKLTKLINEENEIKENIVVNKHDIKLKEEHIKELEKENIKIKEVITDILKTNNEDVQKILKEKKVDELIKKFDEW